MRESKLQKLAMGIVGIYVSYIIYAVYQEKLFSYEYPSTVVPEQKDKYKYSTSIIIFPTLVSFLYGSAKAMIEKDQMNHVPRKEKSLLGILFFTSIMSANTALLYVSYPLQLLVRNLRLMSIFVVGCFFSRLKKTEGGGHLGLTKLLIGLVITIGVVVFNHFGVASRIIQKEKKGGNAESHLIGYVLLAASVIADGFFLDSQAYSKKVYKPTSNELFTYTNGIACLLSVIYAAATGELPKILEFATTHKQVAWDILGLSILGMTGQMSIYYIVKHFQPYVTAIITTVRKIITVLVSILIFHHVLTPLQWVGVVIVFAGVALELLDEMREKKEHAPKQHAPKQHQKVKAQETQNHSITTSASTGEVDNKQN